MPVVYELDYKKHILYVIPIQSILGKLPLVPVSDSGTIPYHLCKTVPGAPGDRRPGAGDGCKMWFVNSWAVVRKLMGFGMVAGHVMKLKGLQRATTHGKRFHVTSMHRHVQV